MLGAASTEGSRLDPYPSVFVQAVGEYAENGQAKTVAIAIGPEFGTVGPELIRHAANEAVKIADLLVVGQFESAARCPYGAAAVIGGDDKRR